LQQNQRHRYDTLVIVLSVAFVAGMAIAVLLVALWRNRPAAIASDAIFHAAVALCPPFVLVRVVGGMDDTALSLVLTAGTIIMANGSLYAGLSAFGYWGFVTFWPHDKPQ
jgi:hypothetical protein